MNQRPVVAIISNSLTPYRLHFHQRVVRELATIEWWSLFTHDRSNAPWTHVATADIRPVQFGPGEPSERQSDVRQTVHEWRKGGRIIRWLREHDARAVVLSGYNDAGRLRVLRWCHRHAVPCFLFGDSNIRGDNFRGWRAGLKRLLLSRILRRATGVLACGSLGQAYFQKYGVPVGQMFLMPYEPDYHLIRNAPLHQVRDTIKKHQLPLDRRFMVFSGRLIAVKRIDVLIDAFGAIATERPEWDLLIVGDGPLRAQLTNRVRPALQSRVHWVGFIEDPTEVARLCRAGDVLVLPSDVEPWGVVVNEAVAAGMAVVASDAVGAAAELVRDRVNGRIFPAGDLAALTECLRDVTTAEKTAAYRSANAAVLADWQRRGDPVRGLAAALSTVGVGASR